MKLLGGPGEAQGTPEARIRGACGVDCISPFSHKVAVLRDLGSIWGSLLEAWGLLFGVCGKAVCKGYGTGCNPAELKSRQRLKSI